MGRKASESSLSFFILSPYMEELLPSANFSVLSNMSVTQAFEAAEKIIYEGI